jgi:hypothetical protein
MVQLVIDPATERWIFAINGPLRPVLHHVSVLDLFLSVSKRTGWNLRCSGSCSGRVTELFYMEKEE